MVRLLNPVLLATVLYCQSAFGSSLWDEGHPVPLTGISNPYGLQEKELAQLIGRGKIHALQWPIEITGALLPYRPIRCLLDLTCLGWSSFRPSMYMTDPDQWPLFETAHGNSNGRYTGPYPGLFAVTGSGPHTSPHNYPTGTPTELEEVNAQLRELFDAHNEDLIPGISLLHESSQGIPGPFAFDDQRIYSFDWWTRWLGLYNYPLRPDSGNSHIPYPNGSKPDYRMGVSIIERNGVPGLTFSCAACHLEELFGRPVLGLTTRFPRANKFIYKGSRLIHRVKAPYFRTITRATDAEVNMLMALQPVMRLVDTRIPQALGLDTALAQVGLSLRHRGLAGGTGAGNDTDFPVSDSKPSVWWNVKYKNRWLSDGALVAGNPVVTNILWNEVGRGTDIDKLEAWLLANQETVREMTAMVYASQAPHITDFFDAGKIDIASAKRGEALYNQHCEGCHGSYIKNWSVGDAGRMTPAERLKTHRVEYAEQTKVKNVKTDSHRRRAIKYLLPLNDLNISRHYNVILKESRGYVPPPLVGIWARWPYFHNNSAPTLCAVLEPASRRPDTYYARPARDREKDFDFACNGYPKLSRLEKLAKHFSAYKFDTSKAGMGNMGHDQGILIKGGREVLNSDEKKDLISFLQTL